MSGEGVDQEYDPLDPDSDADNQFVEHVADQVLGTACQFCHVPGGPSAYTRLVLAPPGAADEDARNAAALENFINTVPDGGALLLSKVQGVDHGGGTWFTSQSEQYEA